MTGVTQSRCFVNYSANPERSERAIHQPIPSPRIGRAGIIIAAPFTGLFHALSPLVYGRVDDGLMLPPI
jgi:hypothetical protein